MKGAIHEGDYTVGLDLAKNVFQVQAVDAAGAAVIRRQVRRAQVLLFFWRLTPCLTGLEACAGACHRARELAKLGHEVRLIPPSYVKPFVKRVKTDGEEDRGCSAAAKADKRCGSHLHRSAATDDALRAGQE